MTSAAPDVPYADNVWLLRFVDCPKNNPDHNAILNLFKFITPPDCGFKPVRIWGIKSKKKRNTCRWKVLYTNTTQTYLQGAQARTLKERLLMSTPMNSTIVDYNFFEDRSINQVGWLFIWKVQCSHSPNFCRFNNILCKEKLTKPMSMLG